MNPQNAYVPPLPPTLASNPLAGAEPGAQPVCEIKRHPIGIMGLYVGVGFLMLIVALVAFVVAPKVLTGFTSSQVISVGALVFIVAALIAGGFLFVAHKVYWGNRWIVSSESITQMTRISLFDKQTSQLSLGDLEDLTAEQDGLLAQMFHYGVISAETAAATDKFTFRYCPKPTYYAQQILAARDRFEQNRQQNSPQPAAPQNPPQQPQAPSTETGFDVPG